MVEIRWAKEAFEDLDEIYHNIARDSEIHAESIKLSILSKIDSLERFPNIGCLIEALNVRMVIVQRYRILYELRENLIEIVRILHESRELKK